MMEKKSGFQAVVADTGTPNGFSRYRTSLLFHFSAFASRVLLFGLSLLCFEARVTSSLCWNILMLLIFDKLSLPFLISKPL
jgi:hypothetical protein